MKKYMYALLIVLCCMLTTHNAASAKQVFNDVPTTHSMYPEIMYLVDKKLIAQATNFYPNEIVTREEVAVMIAKAKGLNGKTAIDTQFKDVKKGNKNSGYIQAAANAGIIRGYTDGTFKPNEKINRGHMATFIARAFDLPEGDYVFEDVSPNHTAYEAVKQLIAANITTGYDDYTFRPSKSLTRSHIAAFIARAIKYEKRDEEDLFFPLSAIDAEQLLYKEGYVPVGYHTAVDGVSPGEGYVIQIYADMIHNTATYDWAFVDMWTGETHSAVFIDCEMDGEYVPCPLQKPDYYTFTEMKDILVSEGLVPDGYRMSYHGMDAEDRTNIRVYYQRSDDWQYGGTLTSDTDDPRLFLAGSYAVDAHSGEVEQSYEHFDAFYDYSSIDEAYEYLFNEGFVPERGSIVNTRTNAYGYYAFDVLDAEGELYDTYYVEKGIIRSASGTHFKDIGYMSMNEAIGYVERHIIEEDDLYIDDYFIGVIGTTMDDEYVIEVYEDTGVATNVARWYVVDPYNGDMYIVEE